MKTRHNANGGFSLVELLIVIFILTLLLQLALPAVQSSREAARRTQCANNLRQLGLASLIHHDQHGFYPSGGWMPMWVGDPLRGAGQNQPGGWIYGLLPFVEEEALYQMPDDGDADRITSEQKAAAAKMIKVPIAVFQCPTRRPAIAYPYALGSQWDTVNADVSGEVARSDYAANGGDEFDANFPFFDEVELHDSTRYSSIDAAVQWSSTSKMNGVTFVRSEVRNRQIVDGLSKTYLLGEKFLNSAFYDTGWDPGDNHSMYQGYDRDIIRWADPRFPPLLDTQDADSSVNFGSVHPAGFYMVMCDASIRQLNYDVEEEIHRGYANRRDSR